MGRFTHGWKVRPECQKIRRPPLEYMRSNFFFDALVFYPPAVRYLVDVMGGERVVLGTDLAYDMTDTEVVDTLLASGLSAEEYANITHRNAAADLRDLAPAPRRIQRAMAAPPYGFPNVAMRSIRHSNSTRFSSITGSRNA